MHSYCEWKVNVERIHSLNDAGKDTIMDYDYRCLSDPYLMVEL